MVASDFQTKYWWVNQNQTYRSEIAGGYIWSPKRKANDYKNHFYETMKEVAPGDMVFSFVDTRVIAIGVAGSYCCESPRPGEFGATGANWSTVGWRVNVSFHRLAHPIRPKELMGELRATLPERYSPLTMDGDGYQHVYLAQIPQAMAAVLLTAIRGAGTAMRPTLRMIVCAPLILCPLLWVGSYFANFNIEHNDSRQFGFEIGNGGVYFYASVNPAMRSWIVVIRRADPRWYQAFDSYVFMGFGAKPYAVEGAETAIWGFIRIPFWFLSGVWAALFWWGWRRTRRKEAKAFPVEIPSAAAPGA